jgi:hypothetical protein
VSQTIKVHRPTIGKGSNSTQGVIPIERTRMTVLLGAVKNNAGARQIYCGCRHAVMLCHHPPLLALFVPVGHASSHIGSVLARE